MAHFVSSKVIYSPYHRSPFSNLTLSRELGILLKNFFSINFSLFWRAEEHIMDCLKGVPEPALRRLPSYCHFLRRILEDGALMVSCRQIGEALHLDPTQVRKDLACTGVTGRPKVGYAVRDLLTCIEDFLGWNNTREAVLVGAGSLGTALMGYKAMDRNGVKIVAAFDTAPEKAFKSVHKVKVLPMEKMVDLVRRMQIHVGILTVPADGAQQACELMVLAGIRAIWNFAPVALNVPETVLVQNENLFSSLAVLSSRLQSMYQTESAESSKEEAV